MLGLALSDDPEDYDGGSVAVHRVFSAGEVKGDEPDKKQHPGPTGWGLGMEMHTTHNICSVEKLIKKEAEIHQGL